MNKFPSINQFRQVKREVGYEFGDCNRTLSFRGTVKLHGTNAAVVISRDESVDLFDITYQSRNNVITPENDNAGFAGYMSSIDPIDILGMFIPMIGPNTKELVVYGEWCGGNIQKGVGISGLDKMFVVFAVRSIGFDEDKKWIDIRDHRDHIHFDDARIFNSEMFQTWDISIDMNNPELSTTRLVEITNQVESECPVAKLLGQAGTGEGVVWRCSDNPTSKLWFKVKGEKHSVSKVKVLADVDPEKVSSICEFVDNVTTDARISQGIEYLKEQELEVSRKSTGPFLSWVFADIMKEEADTLEANGLTKKDVSGKIGNKARAMFFAIADY